MSGVNLLDTRTPYRSSSTHVHLNIITPTSQTGSPGLTLYQRAIHNLIRGPHRERASRCKIVSDRLKSSRDPIEYINKLIDQCTTRGGSEGLDIGIDVLSLHGDLVLQYASEFQKRDAKRWGEEKESHRHHFNDDAWYILLRSAARSNLEPGQKVSMLRYCFFYGPESVREAGVHALGDMGGTVAVRLLLDLRDSDRSLAVREAASEVLNDLEA